MTIPFIRDGIIAPASLVYRHRALTAALVRREILDRYVGQILGALWVIGHPAIQISVFIFLFKYVFKQSLGGTAELPLDYTAYMLSGLIPWLACQEVLTKGPLVMSSNANLVKQVVFPIEILPIRTVLASFASQFVLTAILLAYCAVSAGWIPWTVALLPALWFCQFLAMCGICYVLAAVGTYLRDLKEVMQVFATVGVYLMPVAYLPEWVPAKLQFLLQLNPFSHLIWCYQDACFFGEFRHPGSWIFVGVGSVLSFGIGFRLFERLKIYFGSVL